MSTSVGAIVLAAGKGTRMKATTTNKVAMLLADKPIIVHTVSNLKNAHIKKIVVVVGFAKESVMNALGDDVIYAEQSEQLGTGHAVMVGLAKLPKECGQVISVYGDDSAFYPPELVENLIAQHKKSGAVVTVLTIHKDDPTGLGRIVRNARNQFVSIVEEKVASLEQKQIKEINTGLYCFDRKFLESTISNIKKNPVSGEFYLTDIIEIAVARKMTVEAIKWEDNDVWFGVNDPAELQAAQAKMKSIILSA